MLHALWRPQNLWSIYQLSWALLISGSWSPRTQQIKFSLPSYCLYTSAAAGDPGKSWQTGAACLTVGASQNSTYSGPVQLPKLECFLLIPICGWFHVFCSAEIKNGCGSLCFSEELIHSLNWVHSSLSVWLTWWGFSGEFMGVRLALYQAWEQQVLKSDRVWPPLSFSSTNWMIFSNNHICMCVCWCVCKYMYTYTFRLLYI